MRHVIIHTLTTLYGLASLLLVSLLFLLYGPALFIHGRLVRELSMPRLARRLICRYGRAWLFCVRPVVSQEIRMPDADSMPLPCIVVCNHLSALDIFFMSLLPVDNIVVAVRSWPFKLFWYAPFMRLAGYLDIESQDSEDIRARITACMEERGVVVFFPEGHRSRDGRLQRFHSGAFKAAVELGVPVLPLCLCGSDVLLPRGVLLMRPAVVRLQALPPLHPRDFHGELAHVEMRKRAKADIAGALERLHTADTKDAIKIPPVF